MSATSNAQQIVDGQTLLQDLPALKICLDAVPHFAFSETGRQNLCRRFYLTDEGLTAALVAYSSTHQQPEGTPLCP